MLNDITIGQFFPRNSLIHRLDARVKIVLTILYIVLLFAANNMLVLMFGVTFIAFSYLLAHIPIKLILKSLKPVMPVIIITSAINLFFVSGKTVLISFWIVTITREGLMLAIAMSFRIIALIAGSSLLTYTTSPIELTDAIERLLKPLKYVRFPVHELAMMMTIALRFIPTLVEETNKIMSAQKARGADLDSGNVVNRCKALIPILIPLLISSFRRADELATAMECRCYKGGDGRTRMRQMHVSLCDIIALIILVMLIFIAVLTNSFISPIFKF